MAATRSSRACCMRIDRRASMLRSGYQSRSLIIFGEVAERTQNYAILENGKFILLQCGFCRAVSSASGEISRARESRLLRGKSSFALPAGICPRVAVNCLRIVLLNPIRIQIQIQSGSGCCCTMRMWEIRTARAEQAPLEQEQECGDIIAAFFSLCS